MGGTSIIVMSVYKTVHVTIVREHHRKDFQSLGFFDQ